MTSAAQRTRVQSISQLTSQVAPPSRETRLVPAAGGRRDPVPDAARLDRPAIVLVVGDEGADAVLERAGHGRVHDPLLAVDPMIVPDAGGGIVEANADAAEIARRNAQFLDAGIAAEQRMDGRLAGKFDPAVALLHPVGDPPFAGEEGEIAGRGAARRLGAARFERELRRPRAPPPIEARSVARFRIHCQAHSLVRRAHARLSARITDILRQDFSANAKICARAGCFRS